MKLLDQYFQRRDQDQQLRQARLPMYKYNFLQVHIFFFLTETLFIIFFFFVLIKLVPFYNNDSKMMLFFSN